MEPRLAQEGISPLFESRSRVMARSLITRFWESLCYPDRVIHWPVRLALWNTGDLVTRMMMMGMMMVIIHTQCLPCAGHGTRGFRCRDHLILTRNTW